MSEASTDQELADEVEGAAKAALVPLVEKFHLAGWVDAKSLTSAQLWRTVETANEDERSGFYGRFFYNTPTVAMLLMSSIDSLRASGASNHDTYLNIARSEASRQCREFVEDIEEVMQDPNLAAKTRYHERPIWRYFPVYALPVLFVYLELLGLPRVFGWLVLVASFVLAVASFWLRYGSKWWFFEPLLGRGFRRYPGP